MSLPKASEIVTADPNKIALDRLTGLIKEEAQRGSTDIIIWYNYKTSDIYLALWWGPTIRQEITSKGYSLSHDEGYSSGEKCGGRCKSYTISWGTENE